MAALANQFPGIFALCFIFAFLDAFGIGANDVANSFATSVGSRSLTLKQAAMIAVVTEFCGAAFLGSAVTDTVKSKIIDIKTFDEYPYELMLGFTSALIGSASWVIGASTQGWPVSTTHSIVGALVGVGIAHGGPDSVVWGFESFSGISKIIASWFISPTVAGFIAGMFFLFTRLVVLRKDDSLRAGIRSLPFYVFVTVALCGLYLLLKSGVKAKAGKDDDFWVKFGIVWASAAGAAIVSIFTINKWLERRLVNEEAMKWWMVPVAAFVPKQPIDAKFNERINNPLPAHVDDAKPTDDSKMEVVVSDDEPRADDTLVKADKPTSLGGRILGTVFKGLNRDIAAAQGSGVKDMHQRAVSFDNKTEYLYSFLQVFTAAFASLAHGSNDVGNAVGPLAGAVVIYNTGKIESKAPTPIEIMIMGGIAIDLGLITIGYRVMSALGNKLTLMTPSRGFCMELGAALAVFGASSLGVPVSTTHCIVGATTGAGLMNGDVKAVNWKALGIIALGWVITLPVAGVIAGVFYAIFRAALGDALKQEHLQLSFQNDTEF